MSKQFSLVLPATLALLGALSGCVQPSTVRISDPYGLTELKNYTAFKNRMLERPPVRRVVDSEQITV